MNSMDEVLQQVEKNKRTEKMLFWEGSLRRLVAEVECELHSHEFETRWEILEPLVKAMDKIKRIRMGV